jgi:ubiquinone/menaquinone biosynthesis C-methylase UbiE
MRRSFHLRRAEPPLVAADAFRLPFRHGAFGFVLCSSLLHHFPDARAADLIAALRPFARRTLLILDLARHPLAYCFLPLTKWFLNWTQRTGHDGCRWEPHSDRPWFRISLVLPA